MASPAPPVTVLDNLTQSQLNLLCFLRLAFLWKLITLVHLTLESLILWE